MPSNIEICNNALVMIGASQIADLNGATLESAVASRLFQTTADNWLTLYDWKFATTTALLTRDVTAPLNQWDAAYSVPATAIKIQSVRVNDEPIPYGRFQNKIHCNAKSTDSVYCDFTVSQATSFWPAYFVELIEAALAKKFGMAIGAKLDLKNTFNADLEFQFTLAKNADARQQTTRRVNLSGRGSIIEGRRS